MDIRITCATAETMDWKKLVPFQGDLKKLEDRNLTRLKQSIKKYGFSVPFFLWGDKILDGHQRIKALYSLEKDGNTVPAELPIVRVEAKDEKEAKEKILLISSAYGDFDRALLPTWTADLDISNIRLQGYEITVDFTHKKSDGDDDTTAEELTPETVVTEQGDMWTLDEHKLICGDSLLEETYAALLDIGKEKVQMVLTDPPYNMGYIGNYGNRQDGTLKGAIENDSMSDESFQTFIDTWIQAALKRIDKVAAWYVFMGRDAYGDVRALFRKHVGSVYDLIWNKMKTGFNPQAHYHPTYENLIYTLSFDKLMYAKPPKNYFNDPGDSSVIDILDYPAPREPGGTPHPTMKPVALLCHLLQNSSDAGFIILDSFNGPGSTLIACAKTGRVYRGVELEPKYVDRTVLRYMLWCELNGTVCTVQRNGKDVSIDEMKAVFKYSKKRVE